MRMRSRLASLTLLGLLTLVTTATTPATVRADITRFINEQTLVAAEADLTKLDPAAIETFLMELAKASGVVGANAMQTKEAEAKQHLGVGTKWVNDVKRAGATSIYLIMDSGVMQRYGPTIIIPVPDAKAAAVAKLIPTPGNAAAAAAGTQPAGAGAGAATQPARKMNPGEPQAATVPGIGVVFGPTANVNAVKALKPAPRPDLAAAFKNAGAAPIK